MLISTQCQGEDTEERPLTMTDQHVTYFKNVFYFYAIMFIALYDILFTAVFRMFT